MNQKKAQQYAKAFAIGLPQLEFSRAGAEHEKTTRFRALNVCPLGAKYRADQLQNLALGPILLQPPGW